MTSSDLIGWRADVEQDELVVTWFDELRSMTMTCSDGEGATSCPPLRREVLRAPLPPRAVIDERAQLGSGPAAPLLPCPP